MHEQQNRASNWRQIRLTLRLNWGCVATYTYCRLWMYMKLSYRSELLAAGRPVPSSRSQLPPLQAWAKWQASFSYEKGPKGPGLGWVQRGWKNRAVDGDIAYLKACTSFSAAWDLAKMTCIYGAMLCSLSTVRDMGANGEFFLSLIISNHILMVVKPWLNAPRRGEKYSSFRKENDHNGVISFQLINTRVN